jgi:ankyrin repeat protein
MGADEAIERLVRAAALGDPRAVSAGLAASPDLVRARLAVGATREAARPWYVHEIGHYLYAGDTALHAASAGHWLEIVRILSGAGADVHAQNRRGAQPLHYAADGRPGSSAWNPAAQADCITALIAAGADPNAADRNGVCPLHRAVRTRSAAAVAALLDGGADPHRPNGSGTLPAQLAILTTGRSGSGSPHARAQQAKIVELLDSRGAA